MANPDQVVAILGDSRVFDTYFTNSEYRERYGYDAAFPHILRKFALQDKLCTFDVVHIPDHFRGGTVESNIIRLSLTDPTVIILCDGIWETLVHKDWFIEWATEKIRAHPTHDTTPLNLSYSSRHLADLFIADELPVSPRKYASKQARIISYFSRRRRQCIWMSLPMPPIEHLDRIHFAGNYRCIPEWDECLAAVNEAMKPIATAYGAAWVDLQRLILEHGGFERALIDQWHFSRSFHLAIARELWRILPGVVAGGTVPADHVSREFLLQRQLGEQSVVLFGRPASIARWLAANPKAKIEAVVSTSTEEPVVANVRSVSLNDISAIEARCVVALDPSELTPLSEAELLRSLPRECILVYADELGEISNPSGKDRLAYGQLR